MPLSSDHEPTLSPVANAQVVGDDRPHEKPPGTRCPERPVHMHAVQRWAGRTVPNAHRHSYWSSSVSVVKGRICQSGTLDSDEAQRRWPTSNLASGI